MQEQISAIGLRALVQENNNLDDDVVYRIGDLAKEFDVTLRALRFYEDRDLLSPKRVGATRIYSADDRQRLKLILLSKRFGFSLVDIQEILNSIGNHDIQKDNAAALVSKFKGQVAVLEMQANELKKAKVELGESISYLEAMAD